MSVVRVLRSLKCGRSVDGKGISPIFGLASKTNGGLSRVVVGGPRDMRRRCCSEGCGNKSLVRFVGGRVGSFPRFRRRGAFIQVGVVLKRCTGRPCDPGCRTFGIMGTRGGSFSESECGRFPAALTSLEFLAGREGVGRRIMRGFLPFVAEIGSLRKGNGCCGVNFPCVGPGSGSGGMAGCRLEGCKFGKVTTKNSGDGSL